MPIRNQIFESVSRNIRNDRKFFNEYIKEIYPHLNRDTKMGIYAKNWMANPENARKLMELQVNKKYMAKLLDLTHGKEFRESLAGLTSGQIARKLKIAGVAGAGLAGAIAFMTWFDDESEEIVKQTSSVDASLSSFRATGLGAVIVKETREALRKINQSTGNTEISLGTSPEKGGPDYIKTLVEQKAILDKNLGRWSVVVRSTDNKNAAIEAGEALKQYSANLERQLGDVGRLTGSTERPGRTVEPSVAGDIRREPVSRERIKSVQNWLSSRFPMVGPTGNLDRPTVRALKMLEREYDRLGTTDRFSSGRLLVRPNEGHLIEVGDLSELDKRMRDYK